MLNLSRIRYWLIHLLAGGDSIMLNANVWGRVSLQELSYAHNVTIHAETGYYLSGHLREKLEKAFREVWPNSRGSERLFDALGKASYETLEEFEVILTHDRVESMIRSMERDHMHRRGEGLPESWAESEARVRAALAGDPFNDRAEKLQELVNTLLRCASITEDGYRVNITKEFYDKLSGRKTEDEQYVG